MTAERTEPAQLDTFEEIGRMVDAGVPREHAVAMLYAAVRTSDARHQALDAKIDRLGETMNVRFDAVNENFKAVNLKFEALDTKFEAIGTEIKALDTKLGGKIDALDMKVVGRFDAVDDRFKGMRDSLSGTRWQWIAIGLIAGAGGVGAFRTIPDIIAAFG